MDAVSYKLNKLRDKIERIDKNEKYILSMIGYAIVKCGPEHYTETRNGISVDMRQLDDETIDNINKALEFYDAIKKENLEHEKMLERMRVEFSDVKKKINVNEVTKD